MSHMAADIAAVDDPGQGHSSIDGKNGEPSPPLLLMKL